MTKLRELFDDAYHQVDNLKHPNIDEFQQEMSRITEAAGLGSLMRDKIESMSEYNGEITIETSWSTRGCANSSTFRFPSSFLDSETPEKDANIWRLAKEIASASEKLRWAKDDVIRNEEILKNLKAEMEQA
jgi:hypothetical protein